MPLSNALLSTVIWIFGGHHSADRCTRPLEFTGQVVESVVEGAMQDVLRSAAVVRPAAPQVLLRETNPRHPDPTGEVVSVDVPEYWTVVPYGPLSLEVSLPTDTAAPVRVEQVLVLLDGEPLENNRYLIGPGESAQWSADGRLWVAYVYNLPCPALGRHLIQARYKIDGVWSRLSAPLRYEVRLPAPPRIVALSDSLSDPIPLADTGLATVRSPSVTLKLADVISRDTILVEINGRVIAAPAVVSDACCVSVPIQGHVTSGVHRIAVRSVHGAGDCRITTEASNEVVFHYHDENVYLLRPGRGCENCPPAPVAPVQVEQLSTPPGYTSHPPIEPSSLDFQNQTAPGDHDERVSDPDSPASTAPAAYTLTALLAAPTPAEQASRLQDRVNHLHSLIPPAVQEIHDVTGAIEANAKAAAAAAAAAIDQRDLAIHARDEAERAWQETVVWAGEAEHYRVVAATAAIDSLARERRRAQEAYEQAKTAAHTASTHAGTGQSHANAAQDRAAEAARVRDLAVVAAGEAASAIARVGVYHREVVQQQAKIGHGAAERVRKQLENEVNVVDAQRKEVTTLRSRILQLRGVSENHARESETARGHTAGGNRVAQQAAQAAKQAAKSAKRFAADAREAADTAARSAAPIDPSDVKALAKQLARQAATLANEAQSHAATAARDAGAAKQFAAQLDRSLQHASVAAREAAEHAASAYRHLQLEMKWNDTTMMRHTFRHSDLAKQHAAAAQVAEENAKQWGGAAERIQRQANQHADDAGRHADSAANVRSAIEQLIAAGVAGVDGYLGLQRRIDTLKEHVHAAKVSQLLAAGAKQQASEAKREAEQEAEAARKAAEEAKENAATAAETRELQSDADAAWDGARIRDLQRDALNRHDAAQPDVAVKESYPVDVLQSWAERETALRTARSEEIKADARIAAAEANRRITRATATHAPSSPFYFSSAAYFPIRDFGLRGEVIDGEGAVIYEDMKFSFDRDGKYALEFALSTPAIPATIRMQLLIQPSGGAPWYTITLPPMRFKPELGERGAGCSQTAEPKECAVLYNHKCSGRSEILRRCYPQMAGDATIRREATARFGYGFEATRQAAAF